MKIEKMKKLRNGKYKIIFDNKDEVVTYDDVILEKELLFEKELSLETLKDIHVHTQYVDAYQKMIKKISTKYRSEKEIRTFLEKEGVSREEKNRIISKLKEVGMLDDKRFMISYINDRMRLSMDGPYQIRKDLVDYGICEELLEDFFSYIDEECVREKVEKYVTKKIMSNTKYSEYMCKQKIVEALSLKGFDRTMVIEVFDQVEKPSTDILQREYDKLYQKLVRKYTGRELQFKIKGKLFAKGFSNSEIEACVNRD